ncbi:MAG: YIP1 family protein [Mucilaginibacter sp.]|uniref:YIP1 family protein n=1 Tax=Mucilaginibacter sp. TaxID=1882438 RepID=UPI0031AF948F
MQLAYKIALSNLWKKPKKTFRIINEYELYRYQIQLFVLAGITKVISRQFINLADARHELFLTLASSIAAGALLGWFGLLIVTGLIYITGKWIKGQASSTEIMNMVSYAVLPFCLSLIFTLLCVLIIRVLGFQDGSYDYIRNWDNIYYAIIKVHYYFDWLITAWYFVLLVIGISAVQGFSIWKSIMNFLICIAVIAVPVVLIILYIGIIHD